MLKLWSKRTARIDAEAGPKIAEYEKLLGRTQGPGKVVILGVSWGDTPVRV